MMLNRTITALLLASFFLAILVLFNDEYFGIKVQLIVASSFTLIPILAFNEWLIITKTNSASKKILLSIFVLLMLLLAYFSNYILIKYINIIYLAFWLLVSLDIIFGSHFTKLILQKSPTIIAFFVILTSWYLLLSFDSSGTTFTSETQGLLFLNDSIGGNLNYYFILLFLLVSLSDTSGYIIGKKFGTTPLCPIISPNKTVEGFLSSLLLPIIIFYFLLSFFFNFPILMLDFLFIFICCIYCTIGDLFISLLKRINDVKNTGSILPGHGGILDRIDSYLPVIPIFQFWLFL